MIPPVFLSHHNMKDLEYNCVLSQFSRLDAWNQGVGRAVQPVEALG